MNKNKYTLKQCTNDLVQLSIGLIFVVASVLILFLVSSKIVSLLH